MKRLILIPLLVGAACGGSDPAQTPADAPEEVEGIPELSQALTALNTACTFSGAGIMAVVVADAEVAVIGRRAVDNAMLVNGTQCGTGTSTLLKRIDITEDGADTGDQVVVLDFLNGTFGVGGASAGITVNLGTGTVDALKIRGTKLVDKMQFGVDGINFSGDAIKDITVAAADEFVVSSGDGADIISAAGGSGTGLAFASPITVFGGAGADVITGGGVDDTLNGGDGDDNITGGAGDDTMDGGAGNDTFAEGAATSGADAFTGGAGTDTVSYASRTVAVVVVVEVPGSGTDDDGEASEGDDVPDDVEVVVGGAGDDDLTAIVGGSTLTGGAGNDTLTGDDGDDVLNGGVGDDTFVGGDGDDTMNGDAGDDTFDCGSAADGADVMNGGADSDTVDYGARTVALTVTMDGASGTDGESGENDNVKADIEVIVGGDGDDNITGNSLANDIDGGAGDDTLNGGAGDDTFRQGAAADGADQIAGGAGTDVVDYSTRTGDLLVTMDGVAADDGIGSEGDDIEADVEVLNAGDGDDDITGNALDNVIRGGAGADTLAGAAGNDQLEGDADADALDGGAGDDTLDGGAGTNTLDGGTGDGDICFDAGATNCEL